MLQDDVRKLVEQAQPEMGPSEAEDESAKVHMTGSGHERQGRSSDLCCKRSTCSIKLMSVE
jgi:hypothetical protein